MVKIPPKPKREDENFMVNGNAPQVLYPNQSIKEPCVSKTGPAIHPRRNTPKSYFLLYLLDIEITGQF